jgi:hypothetical protein
MDILVGDSTASTPRSELLSSSQAGAAAFLSMAECLRLRWASGVATFGDMGGELAISIDLTGRIVRIAKFGRKVKSRMAADISGVDLEFLGRLETKIPTGWAWRGERQG